jgi:hypothetical protein
MNLVNTPDAGSFLVSTQINSGLVLSCGDPRGDAMVGPDIAKAQMVLKDAGAKVMALGSDPTRTDPEKHAAAQKLAVEVEKTLRAAKANIERRAAELRDQGAEEAERILGPKSARAGIESELRAWVRKQNDERNGIEHITEALKESAELAGVIYSAPRFLLGLSPSVHERFRGEAIELWAPNAYRNLNASIGLANVAERYDTTIKRVHAHFYNPALASQQSKRVAV